MNPQTKSKDEIIAKVWQLVNALPHRGAIIESDARSWVDEVVGLHGEAAIWHAIRLNGFGGSEIGVLVRNRAGVRADHQASAHDIVAGKLMRKAPTETNGHMTRGHENEEPHSRRFYAKYGAYRDEAAYDALKNAQGRRPWMRYSPDDVVQMPVSMVMDASGSYYPSMRDDQSKRWLIDYKAPSKVEVGDEIAFQYACQLSQGAILCAESGIVLDGMMLSQFDWANWALKDDVVVWDQGIGQSVLDAGDFYWEYVGRGAIPDYIRTEEMQGTESYASEYIKAAEMFANLSSLADAAKKRADEIRKGLLAPIEGTRLAGQKITFGVSGAPVLTVSAKRMLDREATLKIFTDEQVAACAGKNIYDGDLAISHLRELGVDLKPFRKPDLDVTKVYALAAQMGLDPDALVQEQITMSVSPDLKKAMAAFIDENYPLSQAQVGHESEGEGEQESQAAAPAPAG
jgi:hypothetical protein